MIHFVSDYEAITGENPDEAAARMAEPENKVIARHASTKADHDDDGDLPPRRAQPIIK